MLIKRAIGRGQKDVLYSIESLRNEVKHLYNGMVYTPEDFLALINKYIPESEG